MLKILRFALFLFPAFVSAQVNDDFSDNNFTSNPTWSGNDPDWTVVTGELRSNGPAVTPTTIYLSTPSTTATNAQWEFYVNPKCATSSGNFMIVTLMSDQADITGSYNGYYVMIGNTADEISLYRKTGATATMIIDGVNSTVASSSNNPFKVKVIRNAANNWSLEIDNTGTGTAFVSQGTVNDATHLSSSFMGVLCTYSASNNQKYFFDDIYSGPIIIDVTSPTLVSATATSATTLDVLFDETVEQITAETATNYSVNNGIGNPTTALRDVGNTKLVHLTFATPFTSGQSYQLTVNAVEDLANNAISNATTTFSYLVISTANYRDVIVNEIFADPSPQIGLPTTEFIELHNRTSNNFDLTGWTVSDGGTTGTLPSFILQAGQFVILCANADVATYSAFGPTVGLSSWPSLNNTGDTVRVRNSGGSIMDLVVYSDSWYRDGIKDDGGYTLELINPTLDCSGSFNWIASNAASGGTPGAQNSVYDNSPDVTSPTLQSAVAISQSQLLLTFSENMDSASIVNATINLSAPLVISSVTPLAPDFTQAVIAFSPLLDSTLVYTVSISGGNDCSGNALVPASKNFGIGVPAQKYEILINELFPDPDGSTSMPEAEFIELYNPTTKVLSISGYKLSDASSTATLGNAVIFPNSYLLLTSTSNSGYYSGYGTVLAVTSMPSLNNAGDDIALKTPSGGLIHRVNYTDSWYQDDFKKGGGWTLELVDPNNPCGELSNWRACVDSLGGTPGAQNSVYGNNPDVIAPFISLAEVFDSTTLVVQFSEIMDSLSLLNGVFTIDNGITVTAQNLFGDRSIVLTLSPALQYNVVYTISAALCADCVGNAVSTQTATFARPQQADPGDLIINEVLFDPRGSGSDFVEIYNNSQKFISLNGWTLANYSNDTIANPKTITNNVVMLFPGEYLVLTNNPNNIISEYPLGKYDRFLKMSSLPTYSNTYGRVILIDNLNRLSDDFAYDDDMHFALLNSVDGVSLERIDFNRPTQDRSNWHSAAEAVNYATPGYQNSQYLPNENDNTFNINPSTFSPDNDGYNDVVNISYEFDQNGYVGSITIYDAAGRIEKLLMQNELLANKGTKSWDGINEKREKSSVGIYVVVMEVYDLNGNVHYYKKPVVVATKF